MGTEQLGGDMCAVCASKQHGHQNQRAPVQTFNRLGTDRTACRSEECDRLASPEQSEWCPA